MPTPELYRVFPWVREARRGKPGHPLHVPAIQGAGRVDNPERYRTLYASDAAAGAVAEAFGNHAVWTRHLLAGRPDLPESLTALAVLAAPASEEILDLDDARALVRRKLRPSAVVTRDRRVTQRWAIAAYEEHRWIGVRWWSAHDSRWGSFGLWNRAGVRVVEVTPLTRDHPAVCEAADILARPWRETGAVR